MKRNESQPTVKSPVLLGNVNGASGVFHDLFDRRSAFADQPADQIVVRTQLKLRLRSAYAKIR
jgi:hypothetical protein